MGDKPALTLWYLGRKQTPFFSYDQRENPDNGSSWADPLVFGDRRYLYSRRVHYKAAEEPPSLVIFNVRKADANLYRCRVEFQSTTSEFSWIILEVVVPPQKIDILIQNSPVSPGKKNDVICRASGGDPPASVVWIQKGQVVDANYNVTAGISLNTLEKPASREDLSYPYMCSAHNNDVTAPIQEDFYRNVTCGPLSMKVSSHPSVLSEGTTGELKCIVIGSNPPPVVKWFRHGEIINMKNMSVTHEENITTSRLFFIVRREDHRSQVVCRAENVFRPLATLEDIKTLEVTYRPRVTLGVGWPLPHDTRSVDEGTDVFLECKMDANPKVYKITWYKNKKPLPQNDSVNMKGSEATLSLQKVDRYASGTYQCFASNVEGDSWSNNRTLNVRYVPICATSITTRMVPLNTFTNLTCRVDADPLPEGYSWTFNSSIRTENSRHGRTSSMDDWKYTFSGKESTLVYIARSERDYGTLRCLSHNTLGRQKRPCIIRIVQMGEIHAPQKVNNCIVSNVTSHSAGITCQPGLYRGRDQKFHIEVWEKESHERVFNTTLPHCAYFIVPNLLPSHLYSATITAFNQHGRASPFKFSIRTSRKKTSKEEKSLPSKPPPSHVGLALGITFGLLLVLIIVAFGIIWFLKRPPTEALTIRTLSKKDSTKEKGTLFKAATTNPGESNMNGVFEYTIYDSSGRYKGFSNLPQQVPGGRFPIPVAAGISGECHLNSNVLHGMEKQPERREFDKMEISTSCSNVNLGEENPPPLTANFRMKPDKGPIEPRRIQCINGED